MRERHDLETEPHMSTLFEFRHAACFKAIHESWQLVVTVFQTLAWPCLVSKQHRERERERPVDLDTCFNQVFFYRKGRSGAEPDEQHVSGNGTLIFGIVQDQKHPQIQLVTCYGIPGRHACVEVWAMEDILSEQD